jgi:hypothetical protein
MATAIEYEPLHQANTLTIPPLDDEIASWSGFQLQVDLDSGVFHLPEAEKKELHHLELGTFQLALEDVPLESLEASSISAYDTADEERSDNDSGFALRAPENNEDIWVLPEIRDAPRQNKLTSWDHFLKENHAEPSSRYLSEANNHTFDAVLALESGNRSAKIVPTNDYLEAMLELCLGRSSRYRWWNIERADFSNVVADLTVSGLSQSMFKEVQRAETMGLHMRRLLESPLIKTAPTTPGAVALDAAAKAVAVAVRYYMESQRTRIKTFLQLDGAIAGPTEMLRIVEEAHRTAMSQKNDHAVVQILATCTVITASAWPWLVDVMYYLLSVAAQPLLSQLAIELGMKDGVHQPFAVLEGDGESSCAAFCSDDVSKLISEVRECRQLLLENSSQQTPEVRDGSAVAAELTLCSTWREVILLQSQARAYELASKPGRADLGAHIALKKSHENVALRPSAVDTSPLFFQPPTFDTVSSEIGVVDPRVADIVTRCLSHGAQKHSDLQVPHEKIFDLSLMPAVTAQHRILSYEALTLLYDQCKLRSHLGHLHQFHLFGNGLFAARVSRALFDSDESSGEGLRRDGNTTGLRLQDREAWPPRSSELRLVLMGILSEHVSKSQNGELENAVSFSLRDLPEDELERCRDVDSIHALDFLCLQYKPPNSMLGAVICSSSLQKYDRILRHLLRVLRMKSVAQGLIREVTGRNSGPCETDERRFRIQIQHLIATVADYTHNIAINELWTTFDSKQAEMEALVQQGDYEATLEAARCLEHLKHLHESCLDDILRALLLKEKQAKARTTLEELLGIILRYAAAVRKRGSTDEQESRDTTKRYHDDFSRILSEFKAAMQGMSGKPEQLLLRLDMRT